MATWPGGPGRGRRARETGHARNTGQPYHTGSYCGRAARVARNEWVRTSCSCKEQGGQRWPWRSIAGAGGGGVESVVSPSHVVPQVQPWGSCRTRRRWRDWVS